MSGGPTYTVPGATEVKYVDVLKAKALPNKANWDLPSYIDIDSFDFSWHPYLEDEPFIYQFGTQWQKTGGPKYIIEGATEVKYVDTQQVRSLSNKDNFNVLDNNIITEFDYSWHPDETDEPYIYVFGNNYYSAEIMPTVEYIPKNAVRLSSGKAIGEIKYISDIVATLGENKTNWVIPNNIDDVGFDYSWVPNPKDPAYIYEFGTQWQKTGGPIYVPPNKGLRLASGKIIGQYKYVGDQIAILGEN
jgi:hypothetical protein